MYREGERERERDCNVLYNNNNDNHNQAPRVIMTGPHAGGQALKTSEVCFWVLGHGTSVYWFWGSWCHSRASGKGTSLRVASGPKREPAGPSHLLPFSLPSRSTCRGRDLLRRGREPPLRGARRRDGHFISILCMYTTNIYIYREREIHTHIHIL